VSRVFVVRSEVVAVRGAVSLVNARGRQVHREGLLLRLFDDEGLLGQGEASPLPGHSPETVTEARHALGRLGPLALDLDDDLLDQLSALLDSLGPLPPSARFAVETALLDLAGQRTGRSLATLLGAVAGDPRPLSMLLPAETSGAAIAAAKQAVLQGFRTVKLKLGTEESASLPALRDLLGETRHLRLDANGSLPPLSLREHLARLATCQPELLEEPSTADAMQGLSETPIPLALDESLASPRRRERIDVLARKGLLAAVVLKPMVLGGALECLKIEAFARARGVEAIVTHLFDGPVAWHAAAALAHALPRGRFAAGLAPHAALDVWPATPLDGLEGPQFRPPRGPGLGLPALVRP
jgi:o-succinylbenzoate synthase